MGRAPCCEKEGVKKGPWTPEEDLVLVSYVQDHGAANWRAVPAKTGLMRCSKSCRLRWTNYLRPGIRRGGFSEQEDRLIVHLQALLGNRWAAIASYLPNRTDNDVKNYWNTHLKKRLMLHHQQRAFAPSPQPPPPPSKGQWEHRLQADVDHARRALREALSVDATGPTGGGGAITTPALMMSGDPPPQQAYALSAGSVSRMLLDGWAPPPPGKSSAATPPARATESASGSTSELTDSSGGSTSSPSKCATRVAGPLFGRRESAGHGELSAIESWLLEDGGDDELQPAQEGLLLDAALHNFAV
ncbi:hypothetical protein ACP70R_014255 [Stipagrostis hirtigluma subsp. patula]